MDRFSLGRGASEASRTRNVGQFRVRPRGTSCAEGVVVGVAMRRQDAEDSPRFGGETHRTCFWRLGSVSWRPVEDCAVRAVRGLVAGVRRLALLVLLLLLPRSALAQVADKGDPDALMAEVDRDYAAAQAGDCSTACQALDSMRRAADHLCELDPGDRCAKARQRVSDVAGRQNFRRQSYRLRHLGRHAGTDHCLFASGSGRYFRSRRGAYGGRTEAHRKTHGEQTARLSDGRFFPIEISSVVFPDTEGNEFTCMMIRDISSRKLAETEREQLIAELKEALSKVKMLSGFVDLRVVQEDPQRARSLGTLETYIRNRSAADFRHGPCPECC